MTNAATHTSPKPNPVADADAEAAAAPRRPLWRALIKLARPKQWSKSVFCLIGPAYGWADATAQGFTPTQALTAVALCVLCFSFASSACYVINDLMDREADRHHPRKRTRPIAAGDITPPVAIAYFVTLLAASAAAALAIPGPERWLVLLAAALYAANVNAYSLAVKHVAIADVMSLAMGFVLRVVAGCLAIGIEPSLWLLNVTFFLSMFLAFGKRLGERRAIAREPIPPTTPDPEHPAAANHEHTPPPSTVDLAALHRRVQSAYSDEFLRMAVTVTGVTTLVTYAFYIQDKPLETLGVGSWVLWLTMLPSTFGLLRSIVLLERGVHDDPTELAYKDRPFQLAAFLFAALTALILATGQPGRTAASEDTATPQGESPPPTALPPDR